MFNKTIITAGTIILSVMVLIAATQIDTDKVNDQERNNHTLSGMVVDADTEDGVANATVHLKKSNGEDGMQADRTQQDQQQQQQEGVTRTQDDGSELDTTTTDQNGEFEFENLAEHTSGAVQGDDRQAQDQAQRGQTQNNERFVVVVEADGYETEEKEINLSDYMDRNDERGAMESGQDRGQDMDRDREDKDKLKIELTRENQY